MPIICCEKKKVLPRPCKAKVAAEARAGEPDAATKELFRPPRAASPKAAPLASASNVQALELTPPEAAGDAESLGMGNGALQWDEALGHGPKAPGPKLSETCSSSALTDALAEATEHIWQAINVLRMHVGMAGNTLS